MPSAKEPKHVALTPELHAYLLSRSAPLDDVARDLMAETEALGAVAGMQSAPEQGLLLTVLTRAIGARRALEVGTFTGFSALCIARALPPDGQLVCCDVSEEWTRLGRRAWERAGVADRIDLRLAPALETLRALPAEPTFDLAFIDADKPSYVAYWEEVVPRVREHGLVIVDNVLWSGRVVDPTDDDESTVAIRTFNEHAAADARTELVMLPLADGVTVARRTGVPA